jgi:hypothetical protein
MPVVCVRLSFGVCGCLEIIIRKCSKKERKGKKIISAASSYINCSMHTEMTDSSCKFTPDSFDELEPMNNVFLEAFGAIDAIASSNSTNFISAPQQLSVPRAFGSNMRLLGKLLRFD